MQDILARANKFTKTRAEQREEASKIVYNLRDTIMIAKGFVVTVEGFAEVCTDKELIQKAITNLKANNFDKVRVVLRRMSKSLKDSAVKCEKLEKSCNKDRDVALSAATKCDTAAHSAGNKKLATQVGGATGSTLALAGAGGGAVVAAGVVGSVVLGFATFGIGTVIGLAATAGGAAAVLGAAGVGGAIGTHYSAKKLGKEITLLESLSTTYSSIAESSTTMKQLVQELNLKVDTAAREFEDLNWSYEEKIADGMSYTLTKLSESCYKMQPNLAKTKKDLEELSSQLKLFSDKLSECK